MSILKNKAIAIGLAALTIVALASVFVTRAFADEGEWVPYDHATYLRDKGTIYFNKNVHDWHGITMVDVKEVYEKPYFYANTVWASELRLVYAIDCVKGRTAIVKRDVITPKGDVVPDNREQLPTRWYSLMDAMNMIPVARKVC